MSPAYMARYVELAFSLKLSIAKPTTLGAAVVNKFVSIIKINPINNRFLYLSRYFFNRSNSLIFKSPQFKPTFFEMKLGSTSAATAYQLCLTDPSKAEKKLYT